jgi:hypothetical protein
VTRRRELVVVTAVALLVLAAGVLLLVRPKQQAVAKARADRSAAVVESQTLRDQIRALEALRAKEDDLRARARLARSEFPSTPNLPALVDALQDAAGQAGVDLATVSPSTPKASTVVPELAQIDTDVSVAGSYFQIQDFLARLENLVKGADPGRVPPRSVLVQSVSVSSAAGETGTSDSAAATPSDSASTDQLRASISLVVFQRVQAASTPAPAATPADQSAQVR